MLTFTLVADGSSDGCLMPIIEWVVNENFPELQITGAIATDLPPVRLGLKRRLKAAVRLFPCDILFVHRDSENTPHDERIEEIYVANEGVAERIVPIVPIKMTESWLLISEQAIKRAAGNPHGTMNLTLPSIRLLETTQDPKAVLLKALVDASDLNARRRARFNPHLHRHRVAEYIDDFSILRRLTSFAKFEENLKTAFT